MMKTNRALALLLSVIMILPALLPAAAFAQDDTVVLRICNWEEYIDLGGWEEDETIDLDSGDIFGENSLIEDFEAWYEETYGQKVRVEYSTFGTNEDLYNMLTIGDVYDLVCPSEYMIMKLMAEDKVQPLSESFFEEENENNYYIRGVSPYIRNIFETHDINGVTWDKCAAGYMWGVTGFLYNPEAMPEETAGSWKLLEDTEYARQITMKDNVRDAYFAAVGALKSGLLTSGEFIGREDYGKALQTEMNDVSPETVARVQDYLQSIKDNLYSFETDSGKADMITGKVVANYQWSGDAVYAMDQAEEDDYILNFAAPRECTNIYFDGWIMLKSGINGDAVKQQAAEAFINFISRPDNVIRNMYYIGYTSAISGGEDGRVFEYLDWNYGAEDDEEETVDYPVGYFFSGEEGNEDYTLTVPAEQLQRQLSAQYPSEEVIRRASIMVYFNEEQSELINRMWIRIRCFNIGMVPVWVWIVLALIVAGGICYGLQRKVAKEKLYS
jgi:spermidine/putrescine transport system substrate-binding protein